MTNATSTSSPLRQRRAELLAELAGDEAADERGAVYTPPAMAAAMARALLRPGAPPRRVLDPACGTGRLLVAAFQRLSAQERDPERRLALLARLHGAELDPRALEVAKLSLLLAAGGEDLPAEVLAQARAGLDERLRLGDALIAPEAPPEVQAAAAGPALAWEAGAWDAILANPPYTSFYGRASRKPPPELEGYLAERFRGRVGGRHNSYLFFVALCLELLESAGRLCLLVPDTLAINASYRATRAALAERGLLRLCRVEGPVFRGRSVGSLVLLADAGALEPDSVELQTYADTEAFVAGRPTTSERAPRRALATPRGRTWPFGGVEALARVARIRADAEPLERFARPRDGINHGTRAVAERLFDPPGPRRPTWGPLLEGKDVHSYVLDPPSRVVDYDPALLSRADKRRGASLRSPDVFRGPKLVNRQTANTLIFALDEAGYYARNSVHCTRPTPGHGDERGLLVFLLGLLNSRLLRYVYAQESQETRRVHPQVHIARTRTLPIRGASDPVARAAVSAHVEALLQLHARTRTQPARVAEQIEARQAELDALVLDIYEVAGDDRAAIQAWEERA